MWEYKYKKTCRLFAPLAWVLVRVPFLRAALSDAGYKAAVRRVRKASGLLVEVERLRETAKEWK